MLVRQKEKINLMKNIKLPSGHIAIVDDDMFDFLTMINWHVTITADKRVYAQTKVKHGKKTVYMHDLIIGYYDGFVADHINGGTLDNRRSNLRHSTIGENRKNSHITPSQICKACQFNKLHTCDKTYFYGCASI